MMVQKWRTQQKKKQHCKRFNTFCDLTLLKEALGGVDGVGGLGWTQCARDPSTCSHTLILMSAEYSKVCARVRPFLPNKNEEARSSAMVRQDDGCGGQANTKSRHKKTQSAANANKSAAEYNKPSQGGSLGNSPHHHAPVLPPG